MEYRLYLVGDDGHFAAAENYTAHNDQQALILAESVHAACYDAFPAIEVWDGPRFVGASRERIDGPRRTAQWQVPEDVVLDLEDSLQRSFIAMSRSRRLLKVRQDVATGTPLHAALTSKD